MTEDDDAAVYACPPPSLRPLPGAVILVSAAARRRMRTALAGREISAGRASLGVTGPDPEKLSAEEAMRCFGVEQGAA
ncbi:hypothetical protein [Methylobacterium gossipiicola]|uniref:Uncharacterized protein n=1 Tax=Methylobacterium gossipiicola TaxID=582675 RepID=A0A1I2TP36_9HYPH|nr:hypothetical protein [Methylobacterium gossipiicola]SFG65147.1 hypothetical protein SAMN05192565_107161 [Methylobacterium gossipiicola]